MCKIDSRASHARNQNGLAFGPYVAWLWVGRVTKEVNISCNQLNFVSLYSQNTLNAVCGLKLSYKRERLKFGMF